MFKPIGQISLRSASSEGEAKASPPTPYEKKPALLDAGGRAVGFDRELDADLPRRLWSGWIPEHGARTIVRALTSEEVAKLSGRRDALAAALEPYTNDDRDAVEAEVSAMFSGFRAMGRQQGDDVAATVKITCAVLREFPLWAIAEACLQIAQNRATVDGKRLDRRFAPNDSEIHAVVSGIVKLRRDALASTCALLSAPVDVSPEAPRPGRAEIESSIGRPVAERSVTARGDPPEPVRPGYAARVMADLERRRQKREAEHEADRVVADHLDWRDAKEFDLRHPPLEGG